MGRIVNEDDVVELINIKIAKLNADIDRTRHSALSDVEIKFINARREAKLEAYTVLKEQLRYVATYEPRPLHELLAEDAEAEARSK